MCETIERILDREKQYKLKDRERSLVVSYYSSFLYDALTDLPPQDELVRYAAAARIIVSMWADLPKRTTGKVPTDNRSPIARAARIMFFVAELLQEKTLKAHWAREASIAYLQSGNLAAARIALFLSRNHSSTEVPGDVLLDAVLTARPLTEKETSLLPGAVTRPWLCAYSQSLATGQKQLYELCTNGDAGLDLDKSLGYRISQSLPLLHSLSLLKVVHDANVVLPKWYRMVLVTCSPNLVPPRMRV